LYLTIPHRNYFSLFPNQDWGFVSTKLVPHEMGHFFGLLHTFENYNERVVRDGPDANCSSAGDLLCDTPADYTHSGNTNCSESIKYDDLNVQLMPLTDNIMDYSHEACGNNFTPGQLTRIQQRYLDRVNHEGYTFDALPAVTTPPSSVRATLVFNGVQLELRHLMGVVMLTVNHLVFRLEIRFIVSQEQLLIHVAMSVLTSIAS